MGANLNPAQRRDPVARGYGRMLVSDLWLPTVSSVADVPAILAPEARDSGVQFLAPGLHRAPFSAKPLRYTWTFAGLGEQRF
jgi:hypothetical protein